ncbi:MAG: tRNA (adenosine(37)-N6)-dimethylallyltransferase MiaA [Rikenellaceae bacterium]|nr:tRNA (adenosine(37)-N6)-dimethylallyltransferase MiaA [Rikenellaceae bacterium]
MSTKTLIVVVGATGSGKTDLSLRLATHFSAPILSTDSRQLYRGIPIGTAQPTAEQLAAVEHHFIASHDLTDNFNCGEYEVQALARLEELFRKHNTVVAVGGSGLYIQALCEGMDDLPQADEALRQNLVERLQNEGIESLAADLQRLDPDYYEQVDRCNPSRVLRAVEVCMQTGKPYSSLRTGERRKRDFNIVKVGIEWEREALYDRINRRVDMMIDEGLEAEARAVYPLRHLNSLQTVGYREMFDYFDGTTTREEAIELIKRNSRRYAKRQMTWFRRDSEIRWFLPEEFDLMVDFLEQSVI